MKGPLGTRKPLRERVGGTRVDTAERLSRERVALQGFKSTSTMLVAPLLAGLLAGASSTPTGHSKLGRVAPQSSLTAPPPPTSYGSSGTHPVEHTLLPRPTASGAGPMSA